MMKVETNIALKEWAVAIRALGNGEQILLMRKGGIREETRHFEVQSNKFLLYPTYEHQKAHLLKEEKQGELQETLADWSAEDSMVTLQYYAELVEDIEILDDEMLQRVDAHHIWTREFASERLKWKKKLPLHLFLVRVYQLEQPIPVEIKDEYLGCKSWIELPTKVLGKKASPVLDEHAFSEEVARIHTELQN
ncbi:hypothetical protein SAMN05444392_1094 [Seinonella peptonophila]|uniref:DUF1802 family protein n=1 Tax=Seinonella peptonophila TaxID=112248 RepID=A0A1M4ZET5_9BACL|nr:DUF1802 family protein [Seinonella peptonophila]SHF16302.1 hypothetical protein SAMN05444392_1094 [Seinonella peptonophila]